MAISIGHGICSMLELFASHFAAALRNAISRPSTRRTFWNAERRKTPGASRYPRTFNRKPHRPSLPLPFWARPKPGINGGSICSKRRTAPARKPPTFEAKVMALVFLKIMKAFKYLAFKQQVYPSQFWLEHDMASGYSKILRKTLMFVLSFAQSVWLRTQHREQNSSGQNLAQRVDAGWGGT